VPNVEESEIVNEEYVQLDSSVYFQRISEKQLSEMMVLADRENQIEYKKWLNHRIFIVILVLVFVFLFVFLTVFLTRLDKAIYLEIVKIIVAFIGGFGGGYAFKINKKD